MSRELMVGLRAGAARTKSEPGRVGPENRGRGHRADTARLGLAACLRNGLVRSIQLLVSGSHVPAWDPLFPDAPRRARRRRASRTARSRAGAWERGLSWSTSRKPRRRSKRYVAAWRAASPTEARIGSAERPSNSAWNRPSGRRTVQENKPGIPPPQTKRDCPPFWPFASSLFCPCPFCPPSPCSAPFCPQNTLAHFLGDASARA
jgi:hypothetical protein